MDIKTATIYLAFKRMEKEKLISSYWVNDDKIANRKYYKITSLGKEYLEIKKEEWNKNKYILDNLLKGDSYER